MTPIQKVPEDSPERCQRTGHTGQCLNKRVEGSDYCQIHGANKIMEAREKEEQALYNVGKYRERLKNFEAHEKAKSLTVEIAMLRMMLEEYLLKSENAQDLAVQFFQPVTILIDKIGDLVISCQKLDIQNKALLDRNQILQITTTLIQILSKEITDQELLERISDRLTATVSDLSWLS